MLIPFGILASSAAGIVPTAGYVGGSDNLSTVDKLPWATETWNLLATGLSYTPSSQVGSMSDSGVAGYIGGGNFNTVNKFAFTTDVRSVITTLDRAYAGTTGFSNSGVAGYIGTGYVGSTNYSTLNKYAFPTDTRSLTTNNYAMRDGRGISNSGVAGYIGGGYTVARLTRVTKTDFSNDAYSTLGTGLATAVNNLGSFQNVGVAGFFLGGQASSTQSTVTQFTFPTDVRSVLGVTLRSGVTSLGGINLAGVVGFAAGGGDPFTSNKVDRFAFPSMTRSVGSLLSSPRLKSAGFSDEGAI